MTMTRVSQTPESLAYGIAQLSGIESERIEIEPYRAAVHIADDQGYVVIRNFKEGRLSLNTTYASENHSGQTKYYELSPRGITLSASRSIDSLVSEVKRRLLLPHLEAVQRSKLVAEQWEQYLANQEALALDLRDRLPIGMSNVDKSTVYLAVDPQAIRAVFKVQSDRVDLDFPRMPMRLAERIASTITAYLQEKSC